MGTKVQSKPYLPGSMRDLNNGSCNGMWDLCRDDRNSGSGNSRYYDSFLMKQAMDGYAGYAKEQMRQTILKQESIFRHQLQELHRLYKKQRDLMSEFTRQEQGKCNVPAETSKLSHFLSRVPSDASKVTRGHTSDFPQVDSAFGRLSTLGTDNIFSQFNSLKGKSTSKEFGPLDSKCSTSQIRVIDLELPADVDENNERNQQVDNFYNPSTKRSYNLADLNKPIQVEEASFASPVGSKRCCLTEELERRDLSANSSSACWFSSKFPQSNLMEKDGGICPSDSLIEVGKHKSEQRSYNFPDGKSKCYDSSYYNGIYSHQSNSLSAEPRKGIEHLSFPISDQNKAEPQMKRTIFGVEICQRNHAPSFDSSRTPTSLAFNPWSDAINSESSLDFPWRKAASSGQNPLTVNHNSWLGSSDPPKKIPEYFAGNNLVDNSSRSMTSSRGSVPYQNGGCIRNSSAGVGFLSGINSKNSVSDSLEQLLPSEKYKVTNEQKNHENPGKGLPPWLMAKPRSCGEQMKGKETTLYQMNLDSLQNHSQQFFKKAELAKRDDKQELKTVKTDDCQGITKILGVPIIDVSSNSKDLVAKNDVPDPKVENHLEAKCSVKENGQNNCISDLRHHIDLNLSLNEDEAVSASAFPKAVVKIATTEIDLEAPAVLESETDSPEIQPSIPLKLPLEDDPMDTSESDELVNVAAEAIVFISSSKLVHDSCQLPEEASANTSLLWLAEVITSHANVSKNLVNVDDCDEELILEGMDYFEYMTLKLQDTNDQCYKPMILEEEKEEEVASLPKRPTRKGQGRRGRQRKDFQRDVLPSIVSLSRREVTEDLQTFEEVFTAIGVSWQSSLSKRKAAAAKNGRGRRRLTVPEPPSQAPPQPPAPAVQQSICREVALDEKSLSGWGKRTRRLPRQRCPNGGGTHQSLALKC